MEPRRKHEGPKVPTKPIRDWLQNHKTLSKNNKWGTVAAPRAAYYTWIAQEHVTVYQADEMCIEWLGIHPYALYGEEFFDVSVA